MASASKAFPSSSNSSTLSELAVGPLDRPCKSPACPPRCGRSPDRNGTVSATKPVLVTRFLFAENFFCLARDRLEAAFILLGFLFADVRLEGALFRAFLFGVVFLADFFRVVCFLFLGMRAVYHCRRVSPKQPLAVLTFAKLA